MENGHPETHGPAVMTDRMSINDVEPAGLAGCFADAPVEGVPLSFAQRRLWLLEQMEPGNPRHHLAYTMRINGALDTVALEWALAAIVERHEMLRTTFVREGDEAVQITSRHWIFRLARADLSTLNSAAQERELALIARDEAVRAFDLRSDLLLRACLVRLGDSHHALVVTLHRIAADHGSLVVFCKELGELYAAFCSGGISLLPDPVIQYADHACWQRTHLRGETLQSLVNFWRGRLAGAPPLLELPADRTRPPTQAHRGAVCATLLPSDVYEKVQSFSRAQRATPFMTLLAAFKTLLYRYTGQEDIVVGAPVSGRARPETRDLIGPFTNTVALRTHLGGDPTFFELLERVRDTTLSARAHQELPFEKLVDELHLGRDLSYEPVCQIFFSLHEKPVAAMRLTGLQAGIEPIDLGVTRGDLTVSAHMEPHGLRLRAEYNVELFEAGTIERLLGHFATLLEAVTVSPERGISFLPLLTRQENSMLLSAGGLTAVEYAKNAYIHTLFEEQVARTPEATAVVFNDRELSYAELNRLADGVARRLRARGAGPDTLVALCAERSSEMLVGLLGILKSGAAYVPLDPAFPADRLAFMLEDSEARVLVTQRHLRASFSRHVAVVNLDDEREDTPESVGAPVEVVATSPDNLAYVLYTSGSTGRPKGVMVSHRNAVNFFTGMDPVVGTEPGVWLAVTSISFDISVLELFWTLTRGFKVVVLADQAGLKTRGGVPKSDEAVRSMDEQLARHGVTHLQCTPSFARLLTRMPDTMSALRPLRRWLVGGEGLPADLAVTLAQSIDGELVNMYGPTETTVWSTTHKVVVSEVRTGTVDIGRPIANTQVYILDRNRQPVPAGVYGELYIGGDGVARGYWRRPELTKERFVEHPLAPHGTRIYRTGDLARYRTDGVIEFLGRADHQVKVRGHRIELGEIEAVLATHPGVGQSVVVVRTDNPDNPQLVAYVVPASQGTDAAALKDCLRAKLPGHMVPDGFVFLERLPLTPNGKIDRNALPAPERAPALRPRGEATAFVGMEKAIADIWKDLLAIDHLGADDNFFDLGGRSLQVVQMKSRLKQSLEVDLPVVTLFQYPTVRSLADFIGAESGDETFLSKIQERTRRRRNALAGRQHNYEETNA